jgi:hypothetical protein
MRRNGLAEMKQKRLASTSPKCGMASDGALD